MNGKGKITENYSFDEEESQSQELSRKFNKDIVQKTNLHTAPSRLLSRFLKSESGYISPVKMLAAREGNYSGKGKFSASETSHVASRYLPVFGPKVIDTMSISAHISQFSLDGSLLIASFEDQEIRIYYDDCGWKIRNEIKPKNVGLMVNDASLSPDNRFLAYSSILPYVNLVDVTYSPSTESDEKALNISPEGDHFEILSVKFSADGQELVAGGSDKSIHIYDLQENRLSFSTRAHAGDVNAVCFADESGQVMYSGSADGFCKVWDRRCFKDSSKAAGVLTGHQGSITFIDSRRDGRYFISNGEDQRAKLWDIRKMSKKDINPRGRIWGSCPFALSCYDDLSVATYKNHSVHQDTFIRCYFSPAYSTGQKFVYTGCAENDIHIYDVACGNEVARLEYHIEAVRDCSWHPHLPMIVSSSWDGTIARWQFPGGEGRDKTPFPRPEQDTEEWSPYIVDLYF